MTNRGNIVPGGIEPFNTYVGVVLPYMVINATRLTISTGNMGSLTHLITDPLIGWNALHTTHANKATKTTPGNLDLVKCEVNITKLLQSIFNDIPRSAMTSTDYVTFHISIPNHTKGSRASITNIPFGKIYSAGGGKVEFIVRTDTDAKRASMDPLADVIWVDGIILEPGDALPVHPADCNLIFTSKSALFSHSFDIAQAGNRFACFLHYANLTDDSKSGPISSLLVCIIGL
ncbi:MAG: hypothetical protein WCL51_14405 [Bacteroidota bacterium]